MDGLALFHVFAILAPNGKDSCLGRLMATSELTEIKLECANGVAQMYADGELLLETRHRSSDAPVPSLSDSHLKRWADYLTKTDSIGKAALQKYGFKVGTDGVWRRS